MSANHAAISLSALAEVNPKVNLAGMRPDELVSFIPMADLREGGGWHQRQARLLKDVRNGFTPFAEGDVLFAKITPCMENGKGAHARGLVNGVGFGTTELHVLRAKGSTDSRFLYHWLQSSRVRCRAVAFMGGSAGQQRVQSDFFDHYRVPCLEPSAQTRIGSILDQIDAAIERTQAEIAKLHQVRSGLLADLVMNDIDVVRTAPLASMAAIRFSSVDKLTEHGEMPVRLCNYTDVYKNTYIRSDMPFMRASASQAEIERFGLRVGDVIITKDSETPDDIGVPAVVDSTAPDIVCGYHLALIRPDLASLDPLFLAMQLKHTRLARYFGRQANGSTRYGLSTRSIEQAPILKLPVTEQKRRSDVLREHDRAAAQVALEVQKLRSIKAGLMHDLLSGEVRVTPRLETAEVQ